jgi:lysozyme family protein
MMNLTPTIVEPLYKSEFWDAVNGDALPSGVDYAAFDFAVNSGVGKAARVLQYIAGVSMDGAIGPETLAAIGKQDLTTFIPAYCAARLAFLKSLPGWDDNPGWATRVAGVQAVALRMASP